MSAFAWGTREALVAIATVHAGRAALVAHAAAPAGRSALDRRVLRRLRPGEGRLAMAKGLGCRPSLHFKYKGFVLEVQSHMSGQQDRGGDPRFPGVSSAGTRLALSPAAAVEPQSCAASFTLDLTMNAPL